MGADAHRFAMALGASHPPTRAPLPLRSGCVVARRIVLAPLSTLHSLLSPMAQNAFHASIEGAQHGGKSLAQFLDYAKAAGAAGAQPSNYMLNDGKGGLKKAKEIRETFESRGMKLDGILGSGSGGAEVFAGSAAGVKGFYMAS